MQYKIHDLAAPSRLAAIEAALTLEDPAALVDLEAGGRILRVSTMLPDVALRATLLRAGVVLDPLQVEHVPSECCGGCGG